MRSDAVKTGTQQAPHRSLFNALGLTKEEMERPLVGIVSSYNEIVPGHMNLDKIRMLDILCSQIRTDLHQKVFLLHSPQQPRTCWKDFSSGLLHVLQASVLR